jgi:uncharacterized protein
MTEPAETPAAVVRRLYEAFNAGGADAAAEFYDEAIEWHDVREFPDASVYYGKERARRELALYVELGGDFEIHPTELVEAGDRVVAVWTYRGVVTKGDMPVIHTFAHLWTVRQGRVTQVRQFSDPARAYAEAGISRGSG